MGHHCFEYHKLILKCIWVGDIIYFALFELIRFILIFYKIVGQTSLRLILHMRNNRSTGSLFIISKNVIIFNNIICATELLLIKTEKHLCKLPGAHAQHNDDNVVVRFKIFVIEEYMTIKL